LLSRLRHIRPAGISFARTILAAMLALVLLAGVAPLNTLSRSHQCRMACCAGKSPHAEGSCSVALATETQEEEPAGEQVEEHAAHSQHSHQHAASQTSEIASSNNDALMRQTAQHPSAKKSSRTLNVASQAMTTPCSRECAAATTSASTQLPRPRDAAAMSVSGNPRPPTLAIFKKEFSTVLPMSAERRRQLHPRAPPFSLIHLSA
jgi:hypothetical protein